MLGGVELGIGCLLFGDGLIVVRLARHQVIPGNNAFLGERLVGIGFVLGVHHGGFGLRDRSLLAGDRSLSTGDIGVRFFDTRLGAYYRRPSVVQRVERILVSTPFASRALW